MLQHIGNKHGLDRTAQIITYSKYSIRKLLTDSSKAFGLPHADALKVSKKVPSDMSYAEIEKAYNDVSILNEMTAKEAKEVKEAYEELQLLFQQYPKVEIALKGLKNVISGLGRMNAVS